MPKCNRCEFKGDGYDFDAALSVYHDLKCPKCGTTDINTSDAPKGYGYGDDNALDRSDKE